MLVLGSVDLTAQGVGRLPEDFGVGQVGGGCVIVRHAGFSPRSRRPPPAPPRALPRPKSTIPSPKFEKETNSFARA